jgi:hypothetical protein
MSLLPLEFDLSAWLKILLRALYFPRWSRLSTGGTFIFKILLRVRRYWLNMRLMPGFINSVAHHFAIYSKGFIMFFINLIPAL